MATAPDLVRILIPPAQAQTVSDRLNGVLNFAQGKGLPLTPIIDVIGNIILFMVSLAAVLALAGLIYGGIMYMLALGNEGRAQRAKTIIFYALGGLMVIIISFSLVLMVYRVVATNQP